GRDDRRWVARVGGRDRRLATARCRRRRRTRVHSAHDSVTERHMKSGVPGIVKMASRGVPYRLYGSDRSARWWIPSEPRLRGVGAQIYKPTTFGGKLRRLAMANGVAGTSVRLDEATISTWQETLAGV